MSFCDYFEETPVFYLIEDKSVCLKCLNDEGLRRWFLNFIPDDRGDDPCAYCDSKEPRVPVSDLQRHILKFFDLTEIEQVSPRNDGEWLVKGIESWEWIEKWLMFAVSDGLYEDFCNNAVDAVYCPYHWQLRNDEEQWMDCWRLYQGCTVLTDDGFETLYSVDDIDRNLPDYVHPSELPERAIVAALKADAFIIEPKNSRYYRAQWGNSEVLSFDRLTSAPVDKAKANRFSREGTSMFYAAPDLETVAAEIGVTPGKPLFYGEFETKRDLALLDLTSFQKPAGKFDPSWQENYHISNFLKKFADDVSQPIAKDDEMSGYWPTQAFCEFLQEETGKKVAENHLNWPDAVALPSAISRIIQQNALDGIRYVSSKTGKACVVLFCDGAESRSWVNLIDASNVSAYNPSTDS